MTQIVGYAEGGAAEYNQQIQAWWKVSRITGAIRKKTRIYGQKIVELDPVKTRNLTDIEKLILANEKTSPYGGDVQGDIVIIKTL